MTVQVVDRELYTIPEAARILRVPPSTLRWWLEGKDDHQPVIRVAPTGSSNVTWGEFIEAGFLHRYRRRGVSLQRIRGFVQGLREASQIPYPLAHSKPLIGPHRRLVLQAEREAGFEGNPFVWEALTGQIIFAAPLEIFVESIDFAPEGEPWALRLHPAGRSSPVVIDPEYGFGSPTIKGIRTDALAELVDSGETIDDVARDFDLKLADVKAATAYEWAPAA